MKLTDEEISGLTRDWVEARMPSEAQRANTLQLIADKCSQHEYLAEDTAATASPNDHRQVEGRRIIDVVDVVPRGKTSDLSNAPYQQEEHHEPQQREQIAAQNSEPRPQQRKKD